MTGTTFDPTPEQARCAELFGTGRKLRINAYAGTGKTSTLVHLAKSTDRGGVYLAFNKAIADEARKRFPRHVTCSTTHAMAFKAMRRRYDVLKMTGGINGGFLAETLGLKDRGITQGVVLKARQVGYLLSETVKRWQRSDRTEIEPDDVPIDGKLTLLDLPEREAFQVQIAREAAALWTKMVDPASPIPLGHDGYLKLWALGRPTIPGDFILLDEAQDTNGVVLGLMRHQDAQVVAVGDRWQSIYQWRGAINAMVELPAENEARLSTSFRFGPRIADYATRVLGLLGETVPLSGNPGREDHIGTVGRPDAILSRTNSRLLTELMTALDEGRRPYVVGGVWEMLMYVGAAEKLMANQSVDQPLDFFGFKNWQEVREASETEEGAELRRWVKLIDQHGPVALRRALESLPKREEDAHLVLSTGHKAKGREWEKVRLCDDFLLGVGADGEETPVTSKVAEELRLYYVAATRGQTALEVPEQLDIRLNRIIPPASAAAMGTATVAIEPEVEEGHEGPAQPEPTPMTTKVERLFPSGYDELRVAFDFFNGKLFDARLPGTMIVPRVRNPKRAFGQFWANRWHDAKAGETVHEIGMNAETFRDRPIAETLSTLVHEMAHLQQHVEGRPSRNGYHNDEWGRMMEAVGLMPSDTAAPGGKRTGQKVSHYIIEGGPFERACAELLATGFTIPWYDRLGEAVKPVKGGDGVEGGEGGEGTAPAPRKPRSGVKVKYTCPGCEANAWGKLGLALVCGACRIDYECAEAEAEEAA